MTADKLDHAQSEMERASALERAGKWSAAMEAYTQLFDIAIHRGDLSATLSALRGQARVRQRQGRHDEAEELGRLSWRIADVNGLDRDAARAINMVATVRHSVGDLSEAKTLYEEALEKARQVRDEDTIGLVCQNLGVIANIRGDLREARTLYLECVGSAVRSGNRLTAIAAYNNLGMVCTDLKEWMEAELYFDRGIEIALRFEHLTFLGRLYLNRAEPLIHIGELSRALTGLSEAEAVAKTIGDRAIVAAAARFRAIIARQEGDLEAADAHLAISLAIAREARLELEYAEALGEISRLRQEQGDSAEAVKTARDARARFLTLGAVREVEKLDAAIAGSIGGPESLTSPNTQAAQ
ncbi:MAG TPA: tetratricopeptide repeat protein [Longimicrobiaceae bacterium]|nr:tetratricopeptide repeat protein [Longimicrobiaceae bacterium]